MSIVADLLLTDATILTMAPQGPPRAGVVALLGDRILHVGSDDAGYEYKEALKGDLRGDDRVSEVIDVGVGPTPLVYFAANTLPVDGLAMITGSHNPPEYNGFKMGVGKTTFYGDTIQALRGLIERGDFEQGARPGTVTPFDAVTPYLHFVGSTVTRGKRALKVVVDGGNGVGGITALPMLIAEELEPFTGGRFADAIALFRSLSTADRFEEFLTVPAYQRLLAEKQ